MISPFRVRFSGENFHWGYPGGTYGVPFSDDGTLVILTDLSGVTENEKLWQSLGNHPAEVEGVPGRVRLAFAGFGKWYLVRDLENLFEK